MTRTRTGMSRNPKGENNMSEVGDNKYEDLLGPYPGIQTTRFPQVSSTPDYPNNITIVPMGSPQGQPGLKITEEDNVPCDVGTTQAQHGAGCTLTFEEALTGMINKYSQENASNTPDFILAKYLGACLSTFNYATRAREQWYGRKVF